MNQDEKYMREAIRQAKKAYALEEVPIGCVIVYQDKIIGRGYNRRTVDKNTLAHAELQAIRKASKKMDDWRLEDCTTGAVPDVFRSDRAGADQTGGSRVYESQGGLRGFDPESSGYERVQSSGGTDNGSSGRTVQWDDETVF